MKIVYPGDKPTHRYFAAYKDCYVYVVANSLIEVSLETGLPVTKIEVKNADEWEFGT